MAVRIGHGCLLGAFENPQAMINRARPHLEGVHYDTMVGTGFSGGLVVPILARALDKDFLLLRKPGDSHHHDATPGEGSFGRDWIFVDDGIGTGTTYKRVRKAIKEIAGTLNLPEHFKGVYLYGEGWRQPASFYLPTDWPLPDLDAGRSFDIDTGQMVDCRRPMDHSNCRGREW